MKVGVYGAGRQPQGAQAGAVPALFRALAPVHADPIALASEGKCGKGKFLLCSAGLQRSWCLLT